MQLAFSEIELSNQPHESKQNYLTAQTHSNGLDLSPSRKTIVKSPKNMSSNHKSPITASKSAYTNKSAPVSYGELQIILENVQMIKNKAQSEIKHLEACNIKLKNELANYQQSIQRFADAESLFETQCQKINESWQVKLSQQQNTTNIVEAQLRQSNLHRDTLSAEKASLVAQLKDKQTIVESSSEQLSQQRTIVRQLQAKHQELVDAVTNTQPGTLNELLFKIKSECPEGLLLFFRQSAKMKQELAMHASRNQHLQETLSDSKENSKSFSQLIDKVMQEKNQLAQENCLLQEKVSTLQSTLREHFSQMSAINAQKEELISSHSKSLILCRAEQSDKIASLESGNLILTTKIAELQQKMEEMTQTERKRKESDRYEEALNEVCNDEEDYAQLLTKLKYLEKFKSEYYFNVRKIEHLCKLLDE